VSTTLQTDKSEPRDGRGRAARNRELALGVLGGPILWGIQMVVGYALVPLSCSSGSKVSLYILATVTAVLTVSTGILAWRQWQLATDNRWQEFDKPRLPQSFLGSLGVITSLLFLLIIVMTGLANLFLSPCPVITMMAP